MKQEILANCMSDETRVAVLEDGKLVEIGIERKETEKVVGNIYKGKVENVLPGISSAFVNIGLPKNAYLYISDVIDQKDPEEHPPAHHHKASQHIEQMLKKGDVVMVQVAKEAIGTKGVKVTMDISLPGRFIVYLPFQTSIGISKNIEEEPERRRLKGLLEAQRPKKGGFIARTEAEGIDEKDLKREVKYLTRLWDNIQRRYESGTVPNMVHRDLGLTFQTVRDILSENTVVFMIDTKQEQHEVQEFVQMLSPELADRIKLFESNTPIFEAFKIETELEKVLQAKINLPSGGTIVIQEAESLCAIDVNTGKFTGKESQEETVTLTNIEAADEVARQLRLRNIGGIIVIDFIDMRKARNRQKVVEALHKATSRDRAKIKILPITRLGLVEMTRERKRESLLASLCRICTECGGKGMVLSEESLMIKIKKEIMAMTRGRQDGRLKLVMNPEAFPYFTERKAGMEKTIQRSLEISRDDTLSLEDYKIIVE